MTRFGIIVRIDEHNRLEDVNCLGIEVIPQRQPLHIHDRHVSRVVPVQLPRHPLALLLYELRVVMKHEENVFYVMLLQNFA